jgi:hypothetical protein
VFADLGYEDVKSIFILIVISNLLVENEHQISCGLDHQIYLKIECIFTGWALTTNNFLSILLNSLMFNIHFF